MTLNDVLIVLSVIRYQDTVVANLDYYGSADQRCCHDDKTLTSPAAAVVNSDETGSNITSHVLQTTPSLSARPRMTSRSSYVTSMTSQSSDVMSCSCQQQQQHCLVHCHYDVTDKLYQTARRQPVLVLSASTPSPGRVVCCGTVSRKVEPVSPARRPVFDRL